VYGLGANALDARAVEKIFQVKGRPSTSPLIVHVASAEAARQLVTSWPPEADKLARRFWPGPLTLVFNQAGFEQAGIATARMHSGHRNRRSADGRLACAANAFAMRILSAARVPIAAPSANRFTELSRNNSRTRPEVAR